MTRKRFQKLYRASIALHPIQQMRNMPILRDYKYMPEEHRSYQALWDKLRTISGTSVGVKRK